MNYLIPALEAAKKVPGAYSDVKRGIRAVKSGYSDAKRLKQTLRKLGHLPKNSGARRSSSYSQPSMAPNSIPIGDVGFSKRVTRRGRRKKVPLSKQVKELQKKVGNNVGHLSYVATDYSSIGSAANQCSYTSFAIGNSTLEAAFAKILILDEDAPATLQLINPTTATFTQKLRCKSVRMCLTFRNNSLGPAWLKVYCLRPRGDTSITPVQAITNGFADNPGSALTVASTENYPSDSPQFVKLWETLNSYDVYLNPGDTKEYWINVPEFMYDPSIFDSQTESFSRRYGSCAILARIQGVLAHDSATKQNVGYATGTADWEWKYYYDLEYPAMAPIRYKYVTSNPDTLTTPTIATDADAVGEVPASA